MTSWSLSAERAVSASTWRSIAVGLWAASLIAITVMIVTRPGQRTVTPCYHESAAAWWARQPIYEGPEGMNYLPHFMVLFSPYHWGGERLGDMLWRCTAALGLIAGLWGFSRAVRPSAQDQWRTFALASLFFLPVSLPAIQNGQANAHFAAVLLLAAWCLYAQRWGLAAACLWLAVGIKPLGFAAMGLAWAAYPQLWWRLALGIPVFLAFPFGFGPAGYVWDQWLAAYHNLRQCSAVTDHRFADFNGILRTVAEPLTGFASLAVRAAGGIGLMVFCHLGARRVAEPRRALLWLGAAGGFLMVFNPMTEANSYVILAPALAMWSLWEFGHGRRWFGWPLAGMVLTMGLLPNLVRPFVGSYFALIWHPIMAIAFLAFLLWQVGRPWPMPVAGTLSPETA